MAPDVSPTVGLAGVYLCGAFEGYLGLLPTRTTMGNAYRSGAGMLDSGTGRPRSVLRPPSLSTARNGTAPLVPSQALLKVPRAIFLCGILDVERRPLTAVAPMRRHGAVTDAGRAAGHGFWTPDVA